MSTQSNGKLRCYTISEGPNLHRTITNPREEAILDVLGGRASARIKLKMTRQAVHQILTVDRVKDVESAERIAQATREEGREVPAVELLGLAPWGGPERHGTDPDREGRKRPKASSSRALGAASRRANLEAVPSPVGSLIASARVGRIVRPGNHPSRSSHKTACTSFSKAA